MELIWETNGWGMEIPYIQLQEGVVRLTSSYSPENQMHYFFQQFDEYIKGSMLYYVFGIGAGDVLKEMEQRMDENSIAIIFEPNRDLYEHIFAKEDYKKYIADSRFQILTEANGEKIYDTLQGMDEGIGLRPEQILIIDLPNYVSLYPQEKEWFQKQIVDFRIHQEQNRKTREFYLKEVVETPITHMDYFQDAVIVEKWKEDWNPEIPVILVAAGPSLKKNVEWLKEAKSKAIIVAVDMALPTLHEAGVIPDLIANMDGGVAKHYWERVAWPEYQNVPLLCNSCTDDKYFQWNRGAKILFRDRPFIQLLKEEAGMSRIGYSYWGSVAIAVFSIFSMLGTRQIVLVGQDLSYGEDGKSHTGGHNEKTIQNGDEVKLPGYYGGEVRTRGDWYGFWKWFEREIPNSSYQEVINATEGGVHIPGTKQMPLKDVIETWKDEYSMNCYLEETKYRVSKSEYEMFQKYIDREKEHLLRLDEMSENEYNKEKEEIKKWTIYQLLCEVMLVYDEGSEWERLQNAILYLKEHGWN